MAEMNLGLGEYLTVWVLIGVLAIAALGYLFGAALGGAVLFFLAAAVIILLSYAILTRGYRFLLHGSISASGGDD